MFYRTVSPCYQLVGRGMSDCKSTINGGLVFGTESVLESRYVHVAEAGVGSSAPTDPYLLQRLLTVVFG